MRNGSHHDGDRKRRTTSRQKRINELPDDILISIISKLNLKDATSTCILSRRWRHLHAHVTHLNFPDYFPRIYDHEHRKRGFLNYANTVDSVLNSHRGGRIKEMKVATVSLEGANFDKLVEFALTRGAEVVDFRTRHIGVVWEGYSLGLSNLTWTNGSRFLKELRLSLVIVTDLDFDLLVNNFLALESLTVDLSTPYLRNISVVGHPNLKHLDVSGARKLETVEIRDIPNLASLRFCHLPCGFALKRLTNVLKLVELSTSDESTHSYVGNFAKIPPCIRRQLQILCLLSHVPCHSRPLELPIEFTCVKHLELELDLLMEEPYCILDLYPVIEACPSLQKLKIKFLWRQDKTEFKKWDYMYTHLPYKKLPSNLKELEMEGYLGSRSEIGCASYIIKNAVNLEKVIVGTCHLTDALRRESLARARRDFRSLTPPSVLLLIT